MEDKIIIKKNDEMEVELTEKRIKSLTSKFIEACANEATIYDDFNMNSKVVDMLINIKKAFFPATNKNINMNISNFDNKLKTWLEARKEMKKLNEKEKEEGIVVYKE